MIKPYYKESGNCQCGCGRIVNSGKKFISGHNLRVLKRTSKHRKNISRAQKRAWETKRKRLPVGSTRLNKYGYVLVKVVRGTGKWEPQHRLVLEKYLDRKLDNGEYIHHINKDRTDNRIENLCLCKDQSHHNRIEATYNELCKELLEKDIIYFDTESEEYRLV